MKKWEVAAKEFIKQCNFYDDIETVYLTGSHAAGNADEYSDIDLYIVLSDSCDWRIRGNKFFNNKYRTEYFVNPVRQIIKYIDSSFEDVRILEINMILNGIVIYDKNTTSKTLRDYCLQKISNEFPAIGEYNVLMGQYLIWDNLDELTRAYENKTADFVMQYYMFINNAFEFYSRYICSPDRITITPNNEKIL